MEIKNDLEKLVMLMDGFRAASYACGREGMSEAMTRCIMKELRNIIEGRGIYCSKEK